MIESVNNERIKEYAKLNDKKYRDKTNMFIVEGEHLVSEASLNESLIEAFSLDGSVGTKVSIPVMKKLSNLTNVPNVLGIAKKNSNGTINGNILILDGIQDPGNLGTIIRSAVAFNINTIIASKDTVDLYNSKVIRSTEGLIFKINYIVDDLEKVINSLKDKYDVITTNVTNGTNCHSFKVNKPFALIMGNEGNGVRSNISKLADRCLYIPISNCESLNVAIATSIILYEFNK
jgi:TrmH family RNA methyltransferase